MKRIDVLKFLPVIDGELKKIIKEQGFELYSIDMKHGRNILSIKLGVRPDDKQK